MADGDGMILDGPGAATPEQIMGETWVVDSAPEKKYTELPEDKEAEKTPPPDFVVDGDDIPEPVRGKSVKELADYAKRAENALRMSEQAREALLAQQQAIASQRAVQAPQQTPQELSATAIHEMLAKDPASAYDAIQHMIDQRIAPQAHNFQQRMEGLLTGAMTLAEQQARAKYPLEFSSLSHEIKSVVDQIPDRQGLTSTEGWDRVVAFVRGQHIDKYLEARDRARAQTEQRQSAGPSLRTTTRMSQASPGSITDPVAREIMSGMGYDPDNPKDVREWNHWKGR